MFKKFWMTTVAAFLVTAGWGAALAAPQTLGSPQVIEASRHDISPPLAMARWYLPPLLSSVVQGRNPSRERLNALRKKLIASGLLKPVLKQNAAVSRAAAAPALNAPRAARDSVLQRGGEAAQSGSFTTPILNFDGLGIADATSVGEPIEYTPPDANSAVGMKYVVEVVNLIYAAYDKSDGSRVLGPIPLADLWSGFGGTCGAPYTTLRHPTVLFDQLAQRWVISVVAPYNDVYCVAISTSNNPAGAYYRYEFDNLPPRFSTMAANKMGLWPNSYLATMDMTNFSGTLEAENFVALDRAAMLQGGRATMLLWSLPQSAEAYGDLPVSVYGFKLPPASEPALFANYVSPNLFGASAPYAIALWKLDLDWSSPGTARLTGPFLINVPPFNDMLCGNQKNCIPQPAPGELLDAVSDRLMYPLAYRNFGGHEALVTNQTVTAAGSAAPPAGIRWYELDTSAPGAGDWSLKQSGTFDPADGNSRWIGSLAMDASGDMALGYSLSGPDTDPSVLYTGRKAGDPAGKMTQPETTLVAGDGVQQSSSYSWGAFSSMAVDPANGCTFWYTNEYYPATGSYRWNTRIGAFRFASCEPTPIGSLQGTVTNAATGATITGAEVVLSPDFVTTYSKGGNYQYSLPPGSYTASVFDFGFAVTTAQVTITGGDATEEDFALQPAPTATLSGHVTDAGHGYGLYAEVKVDAQGIGQVADVWTDPATGAYSVALPKGIAYTLLLTTYQDGYSLPAPTQVTLNGNTVHDFALAVGPSCSAPGYAVSSGFGEDFNGTFPPRGWTLYNGVTGSPVIWNTSTYWGDPNWTGGSGTSADMNSSAAATKFGYTGGFDGFLTTPPIPVSAISADPVLQFKMNYAHFDRNDQVVLDIFPIGGTRWIQVKDWTDSVGTPFGLPGHTVRINLAPYIPAGTSTIYLEWGYQSGRGDKWYAQLDDVVIGACNAVPGGLVAGRVTDSNTGSGVVGATLSDDSGGNVRTINNPADSHLASGSYVIFSPAGKHGFAASASGYSPGSAQVTVKSGKTVTQDFALGAGRLAPAPGTVEVNVPVNGQLSKTLTVNNTGSAAAHYRVVMLNAPASADKPRFLGPFAAPATYKKGTSLTAISAVPPVSGQGISVPAAPASSPNHAGDVIATFTAGFGLFSLGVDRDAHDLWLGNVPANVIPGVQNDLEDHRYWFEGTDTGDAINVSNPAVLYMADMAYDDVTGMLWQLSVDQPAHFGDVVDYSHLYELDPQTMEPTGKSLLVPSAQPEHGLAFDPVSGTWYAGDFNSEAIYRFDAAGVLLSSVRVGLPIQGLAYNPGTGHLFVLTSGGDHAVYVLDVKHDYAVVKTFDIPGFSPQNAGSGLGYDCAGHLWITDDVDRKVFEVASGETGWCAIRHIPWLTLSPAGGTLATGASAAVTLDFNGTGQAPFTTSQAQLKLSGSTPYPVRTIPLIVHWDPQPVNLAIAGSASPNPVNKGSPLAYSLTVTNRNAPNQGSATETRLTYRLPAGASFVSGGGDGVACSAANSMRATALVAASAPAAGTVGCALGTLAPGVAKAVTVVVKPGVAGTVSSTFDVSAREPASSAAATSVTLTSTVIGVADLSAGTQDLSLKKHKTGTLQFKVQNAGPDTATGVTFTVTTGSVVALNSAQASRGTCEAGTNGIDCSLGDLASGASATVEVQVNGSEVGSAAVSGQAATAATDPDQENNVAQASVTVVAPSSGGGGGFALFGLLALLGIVFVSLVLRRCSVVFDRADTKVGKTMIKAGKTFLSVAVMAALVSLVGIGLTSVASSAQAKTPVKAQSGLRAGLTSAGIRMAHRDLAPKGVMAMSLQSVPNLLKAATLVGAHAPTSMIGLAVSLKLRNRSRLKQFLQELRDPSSPSYRQFLTPAEFTAQYGPAKAQVAAVEKCLKGYGIEVESVAPNRLLIHTSGTTVAYEHALGVQINDYELNGRRFFSTNDRPKLPVAIAGYVQNVIGLNNAAQMSPMSYFKLLPAVDNTAGRRAAPQVSASATPAPPPQSSAYYNPLQIGTAYDWPSITGSDNGSGVTIAIVTAMSSNLQASDYAGFWSAFDLPDHTVNLIDVDGDKNLTNGMGETLLDMEWSGAMAPGANLDVYIGSDPALSTFIDAYNKFVIDNNAQVMTTSWGAPETSWGTLAQTADNIFAEAAAQGISMFAAAGDHGSGDGTGFANMADFPSVDPYVMAANGTELYANAEGDYLSETAWSDTGGAISQSFTEPAWQTGPGVPQNNWRNNSDLSMNAGPARPYLFLYHGQWSEVWGTSAVAPQLAALFAVGVWQDGGRSLGQSNELIYADVNAGNYASDFRDVTTGNNGAYNAGPNWDHPTGWGSPKASDLLAHLGVQGPVGTLEGTVTDAASGAPLVNAKITVMPGNISRLTPSDGTYLILLAPGSYTVTVTEYGYQVGTASVTITNGNTTTQDFSMQTAPSAKVSGRVKDASGHGYGLYAEIKVTNPEFGQVADLWSRPTNGRYSVSLPEGFDYTFTVAATLNGYSEGNWTVSNLAGSKAHNFNLAVTATCTAPGYEFDQGFGEDFNAGFPPAGWSTTFEPQSGAHWAATRSGFGFNNLPNFTGGTGEGAVANAGGTAIVNHTYDSRLITPPIPVTSLPSSSVLTFLVNYQHTLNDALDVDVSGDGGTTWTNMAHLVTSYGAFKSTPGASYSINLANYIPAGATSIEIRWRYINSVNYIGNYAEVDDVSIGACQVLNGGLIFGQVKDANTGNGVVGAVVSDDQGNRVSTIANAADPNFPVGGYLLFAPAGNRTLTVSDYNYANASATVNVNANTVTTQNLSLESGQLTPNPAALDIEAAVDGTTEKAFTIANTGQVSAQFDVRKINMPAPGSVAPALRIAGTAPGSVQAGDRRHAAALSAVSVVPESGAGTPLVQPTAGPATQTAGAVIATFRAGIPIYGLGVDHDAGDLWLGSPLTDGGDDADHRFLFTGTNTGAAINVAFPGAEYMADMAYDDNTAKLWQLSVDNKGASSCIHELDPVTLQATGKKVCPPFPLSQRGLAYDPVGNTWITGDFLTKAVYQVNSQGQIVGSAQIGVPIQGLAYNAGTGHLFVLTSGGHHAVYVYDVTKGFLTPPTYFDIPGFNPQNAGAGFGYDCDGHLWISDNVDNEVFEVASGEKGWCAIKHVPWLTVAPAAGTLAKGNSATVTLAINGAGQKAFTTSRVQLKLSGTTPYAVTSIPVTVHWEPQPVDLVLTGSAAPTPVQKGSGLVYSLTVKNDQEASHGAATETELTYTVPAGASYVSGSGDGVTCAALAPGSTAAPAVASASSVVRCNLGTLSPGASKVVTIAVNANAAGTLTSVFSVKSREPDSDSSSNTISLATPVLGTSDVGVSTSGVTIKHGASGTIELEVGNAGPDPATAVELKLAAAGDEVTLQSASSSAGSCASANGTIDCKLGQLAAKGTVTVTLNVLGAHSGSTMVTGRATTSANDPNPGNDIAQATVTVKATGGGGGSFGWLALAALLGLTLLSGWAGSRRA